MMVPLRRWSFCTVLSGCLTGCCLMGITAIAGEGIVRMDRPRKPTASAVQSADYDEETLWEIEEVPQDMPHELPPGMFVPATAAECPPANGIRLSSRLVPAGDIIGKPLHHLNFTGDCYGENWRTQNWNYWSHSGRFHNRTHSHSLGMECWFGQLFGKLPRGYIHDTSGHPLRSYFVPQPSDQTLAFVPGSDTMTPPRMVLDYSNYQYQPSPRCGPACEPGSVPAGRSFPAPATAPRE